MNVSPLGIALIQFFEEYRDVAYRRFPHEPWTCGWGHTKGVTETTTCTPVSALQWLEDDLADAKAAADTIAFALATQHQFDALVSLIYNIGATHFYGAATLQSALFAKQWVTSAMLFLAFDHINGVPDKGLLRRRQLEKALFLDGVS